MHNISEEKSNDPSSFRREQSPADIVHVYSVSQSVPESLKFHRPRPIGLALKEKVEADLDRQEKLGILEKVETAQWAALLFQSLSQMELFDSVGITKFR